MGFWTWWDAEEAARLERAHTFIAGEAEHTQPITAPIERRTSIAGDAARTTSIDGPLVTGPGGGRDGK